jgi:hypothetical protein
MFLFKIHFTWKKFKFKLEFSANRSEVGRQSSQIAIDDLEIETEKCII